MIMSYRAAQFAARAAAGSLSEAAVRAVLRELAREMAILQDEMRRLSIATPAARVRALEASALLLQRMQRRLSDVLARAVRERRAVAFDEVAAIWQEAAIRTARVRGVPDALLGAVRQPPLTMLGAYESLGGASRTWRTALTTVVEAARVDLDGIVRAGIAEQLHPEEIARRLRPYVLGAEPFHKAFPSEVVTRVQDLRQGVPPGMREAGRKLAYNARRIAYSEVHNARAEAETTHFALDPMVEAVQWTLSPYRGQVDVPDACDMLATADWYGLGPGLFPVTKVPGSPHPFDRSIAAWTPVLTEAGWRRVDEVVAGERVWTHRSRWQVVTESLAGRRTAGWLELRTDDGRVLTVTDDHPVLLRSGAWKLAGLLRAGDAVVVTRDLPNDLLDPRLHAGALCAPAGRSIEDEQRPVSVGECVRLPCVLGALSPRTVPAAVDLDRDTVLRDSKVEVEHSEGVECHERDPDERATIDDGALVLAESLRAVDGERLPLQRLCRPRRAGAVQPSDESSPPFSLGGGHALAYEHVRLGPATAGNAPLDQPRADRAAIDTDPLGDGVLADLLDCVPTHDLCTVELVDVRPLHLILHRWCLTVANDKSFVAAGIVIHNCERIPVTRRADQAADPKPNPARILRGSDARIPSAFGSTITEAHAARVLREAERAVSQGEAIAGASGLSTLVSSGLASAGPLVDDIRDFRAQLAAAGGRR